MKDNNLKRYILITPVKDEEKNLPNLIQSVIEQTIKPALWVIVDDGSTDKSPEIIRDAQKKYNWIQSIRLGKSNRDNRIHISQILKKGFEIAINYCLENSIYFDYLCNVDGDMILGNSFFEDLLKEFEKNPKLGIACGGYQINDGYKTFDPKVREDMISGGEIMYRRKCFENIGGISTSSLNDSIIMVKAKLNGWEVKRFEKIKAIQTRETGSAEGLWKGYKINGFFNYYQNYNPLIAVAKGLKFCLFKKPYYIGVAYLLGYFDGLLHRKEQINDEEVRKYFYWYKPIETWRYYWNAFKNKISKHLENRHK